MDVISHGLWGGLVFGRQRRRDYWIAFCLGVAPDVLAFAVITVQQILGVNAVDWSDAAGARAAIPDYVYGLYDITHSLVVFTGLFGLVWLFKKKPYIPLLAWGFHILLDIFTHSADFFPTPIFWPISDFHINGVSWSHPIIFASNWILLLAGYAVVLYYRRTTKNKKI